MRYFLFLFLLILAGCNKIDTVVSDDLLQSGGEYWEQLTIQGQPAGFQQTVLSFEKVEGQPVKRFERQSRLIVLRYGNRFDVALRVSSVSRMEGGFLSGTVRLNGGGEPIETSYQSEKDQLIVSDSAGQTTLPWQPELPGPETLLCELLKVPMQPGEKRQLTFFEPAMQSRVVAAMVAGSIERVEINGVTKRLLRIEVQNRLELLQAGVQTVSETLWTDSNGNIIRREMPMDGQMLLAVRVPREKALGLAVEKPSAELGNLGVIPLNSPILQPHRTARIEFLVETKEGSPTDRFPQTPFQSVEWLDTKRAKITVFSAINNTNNVQLVTSEKFIKDQAEAKPEELASCSLINLNDPQLLELANQVNSDSLTPRQTVLALEQLVHKTIRQTSFSIALASSSDVLKSKSGDCTEFAVLLAALCRAKKIPARVTLGLVYTTFQQENRQPEYAEAGMVFHLWNEVLIDGVWQPLDATLALGGADAARIKIADENLSGNTLAPLCHSLLGVIGQIKIETLRQ
ncbi:MAG: transglutaminase family protein [Planctomycetaceae bacterium]|jgi:hypothetical protein|nr:transglutaminase family protein [Planctomycetaceae bacterium]